MSLSQRKAHSPPPFRPSRLSISSGPLSPAMPLTPPASRPCSPPSIMVTPPAEVARPEPQRPLPWLWTCHQCGTTYPLAATRRCLSDGHYFCSGTTYNPRTGRTKRHRSCSSEFDYVGWQAWSEWRDDSHGNTVNRKRSRSAPLPSQTEGCWKNCNYPSECRWGARSYSPISPVSPVEDIAVIGVAEPAPATVSQATKDDIVEQVVLAVKKRRTSVPTLSPIKEEGLLSLSDQARADEASLSPTSPLAQRYSLPTFDFPAPPQSHMPNSLFTLAEVDDEDLDGDEDIFGYENGNETSDRDVTHNEQGDWMDLTSSSSDEEEEDAESLASYPSSVSCECEDAQCEAVKSSRDDIRIFDYQQRASKGFSVCIEDIDMESF